MVDAARIREIRKKVIEIIIIFLIENFDKIIRVKIPIRQKIKCFFIKISYFSSGLVDALKTPKIPIVKRTRIEKKIHLSIPKNKFLLLILLLSIINSFFY